MTFWQNRFGHPIKQRIFNFDFILNFLHAKLKSYVNITQVASSNTFFLFACFKMHRSIYASIRHKVRNFGVRTSPERGKSRIG